MLWPQVPQRSTTPVFFLSLSLLLMFCLSAVASNTIDVCQQLADLRSSSSSAAASILIVAEFSSPSSSDDDDLHVLFEGCSVDDADIIIGVPVYNGSMRHRTTITARHVILSGGSLSIQPYFHSSTSYEGGKDGADLSTVGLLHNIRIEVEDVAMHGSGNLLVVDATSKNVTSAIAASGRPTLTSVFLSVQHTVLFSDGGNIASFLAPPRSAVHNAHVFIGTNNTIWTADQFIGSIIASNVTNCSLALSSAAVFDHRVGKCRGGSVALRAGIPPPDNTTYHQLAVEEVGILSMGLINVQISPTEERPSLHVDNVRVYVSDDSSTTQTPGACAGLPLRYPRDVLVRARSPQVAAIGSVCSVAPLTLTGEVRVQLIMSNDSSYDSTNMVGQNNSLVVDGGTVSAVGSVVVALVDAPVPLRLENASLSLSLFMASSLHFSTKLSSGKTSIVAEANRVSAICSLVAAIFPTEKKTRAIIVANSNISMVSKILNGRNVAIFASEGSGRMVSTVFSFAVLVQNSLSSTTTVRMASGSSLLIATEMEQVSNATLRATAVLGVMMESWLFRTPHGSYQKHILNWVVQEASTVSIIALLTSTATPREAGLPLNIATAPTRTTQAALGASVSSIRQGDSQMKDVARIIVHGGSQLLINVFMSQDVKILANESGNVAMLGFLVSSPFDPSSISLQNSRLQISVGAIDDVNVEAVGAGSVVGGLASRYLGGMNASNTMLEFCSDNTTTFAASGGGVVLKTKPVATVNTSIHLDHRSCTPQHVAVKEQLADAFLGHFPNIVIPRVPPSVLPTPTRSITPPVLMASATLSVRPTTTHTLRHNAATHTQTDTKSVSITPFSTTSHSKTLTVTVRAIHHTHPKLGGVNETESSTPETDAILTQKTTVTVVSSTVLVTSVVNSGGPGLHDVQALVVLGSMACATEEVQTISSGGEKSVVPFELPLLEERSRARTMASNVVVILAVALVQALVAVTIKAKKDKNFVEACGLARFPAWSFSTFVLLYQGTILTAFHGLFSPSTSTDRILGAVLVVLSFAVPLGVAVLKHKGRLPATFIAYEEVFSSVPSLLRKLVFPTGFYDGSPSVDPDCIVRRFSTLFTRITNGVHPLFTILMFVKAFLIALIAALPPNIVKCTTRFSIIGAMNIVICFLVAFWWPFRVSLNNVLSVLSNLCTAALCFASVKPEAVESSCVASIVTATVGLGLGASIAGITMKVLEAFKWKKEEQRQRANNELNVPMMVVSTPRHAVDSDTTTSLTQSNPLLKQHCVCEHSSEDEDGDDEFEETSTCDETLELGSDDENDEDSQSTD